MFDYGLSRTRNPRRIRIDYEEYGEELSETLELIFDRFDAKKIAFFKVNECNDRYLWSVDGEIDGEAAEEHAKSFGLKVESE